MSLLIFQTSIDLVIQFEVTHVFHSTVNRFPFLDPYTYHKETIIYYVVIRINW